MRDMTEGSIKGHLLSYAVPMVLGNLLQLTYNAVDSIVIGKFVGADALAAVSTANPIMTIVILGVSGLSIGAGVLMSEYYGAKDASALKREFSTTILFGFWTSLVVFALGFLFSSDIIRWINVPSEAADLAVTYLRIVFIGFLFTFQYNLWTAALRSIGDSKTPVAFLGFAATLNIFLDLLFVACFRWGVIGAGIATVISQALSALLCMLYVSRHVDALQLGRGQWVIDHRLLKATLRNGLLTALQQAAQPIGKLLIQSVINSQGIIAMGAFNAVCRVDDFGCIPAQSIGHSIMTCAAQNHGARKRERVRQTFREGMELAVAYFPIICVAILLLKRPVALLLTPTGSTEMIRMVVDYLAVKAFFYIMPCLTNAIQGFFRGVGNMKLTLYSTLIQISIRTVLVFLWVPQMGIVGEAWACLGGWSVMLVFEYGYYFKTRKQLYAVI
ncbi:MAG: MATE family efflux transporter [Sphaerochaetaceae bacterium]|nr:MATE family efflux transporter [Spirochaetales bacterium]MDY5498779.1 MATE family efflux transporter [Sphaerochaetaceae bacterium]